MRPGAGKPQAAAIIESQTGFDLRSGFDVLHPARHLPGVAGGQHDAGRQAFHPRHRHVDQHFQPIGRQVRRNGEIARLGTGARAGKHSCVAVCKPARKPFIHKDLSGQKYEAITRHIGIWRHDIDTQPQPPRRRVPRHGGGQRILIATLRLALHCPHTVIIEDQRHIAAATLRQRAQLRQPGAERLHFRPGRSRLVIGPVQPGVHGFLPGRRLPPAEPTHALGAMGDGFPAPKFDRAFRRCRVPRRPVHRAGLLFDHPPAPLPAGAIKAVVKGGEVRMAGAQVTRLVSGTERSLPQETDRVGVPRRHIELPADGIMIKFREQPHEIVDDIPPRRGGAQDFDLGGVEALHHGRGEALPDLPVRRVAFGDGAERGIHLVEAEIFLAPEGQPPRRIQRLHTAITLGQPAPERRLGRVGRAHHRVMATIFIVGLPRHHGRVLAITIRHQCRDALGLLQIHV